MSEEKHHPIWAWMPVFAALASMLAICTYRYIEVWTPLQRFYFKTYTLTGLRRVAAMANSGHYELLAVTTKNESHWASNGEVTGGKDCVRGKDGCPHTGGTEKWRPPPGASDRTIRRRKSARLSAAGDLPGPRPCGFSCDRYCGVAWGSCFFGLCSRLLKEVVRARGRRHGRKSSVPQPASSLAFHRTNPTHGIRRDLTDDKAAVAVPKKQPPFIETRLTEVKPDDPPKVVTTAASGGDDARPKIMQGEIKQEPEHKLSRRPARKERYFQ